MAIVKEVEKVIAQLPLDKAVKLRYWLDEFKAARRYKKLKAYSETLADFQKSNGNALWN